MFIQNKENTKECCNFPPPGSSKKNNNNKNPKRHAHPSSGRPRELNDLN